MKIFACILAKNSDKNQSGLLEYANYGAIFNHFIKTIPLECNHYLMKA